jgi:predicted neutral ceramidase superfamily lipid hydrolase
VNGEKSKHQFYGKKVDEIMIFFWAFAGVLPALILRFIFGKRFDVRSSFLIALVCSFLTFLLQMALEGSRTFVFGITFPVVYAISKDEKHEKPDGMDAWEFHRRKRG